MRYLLSIDQGTTSSRAILYDFDGVVVASCQREFRQSFPSPGWVEHDPEEIWRSVVETIGGVLTQAGATGADVRAIGITNQRETAVIWDRETGVPVCPAIVWQDRRTAARIAEHFESGVGDEVRRVTGLELDPYFSATKFEWILDHVPGCRARAEAGSLIAGTVDSWLVWKLTGGREHLTDVTNASRTMLMDLDSGEWSERMAEIFRVPLRILPSIVSSSGMLAEAEIPKLGLRAPVCGIAGDQQAALFGQRCTEPGAMKCTYGTGCFLLMFTGRDRMNSAHRLLSTVAWKLGGGPLEYALEGGVFVGGAAIQWLRDGLGIIKSAPDVNALARTVPDSGGAVLVPAFAGLGAPHWEARAQGVFAGITRGTTAAHLARATLEGIAFQVMDLVNAMRKDGKMDGLALRVDGGASASDLLMQMQADVLGLTVERPAGVEATAAGAAYLAGLGAGVWGGVDELPPRADGEVRFEPLISKADREKRAAFWQKAVGLAEAWAQLEETK